MAASILWGWRESPEWRSRGIERTWTLADIIEPLDQQHKCPPYLCSSPKWENNFPYYFSPFERRHSGTCNKSILIEIRMQRLSFLGRPECFGWHLAALMPSCPCYLHWTLDLPRTDSLTSPLGCRKWHCPNFTCSKLDLWSLSDGDHTRLCTNTCTLASLVSGNITTVHQLCKLSPVLDASLSSQPIPNLSPNPTDFTC